MKTKAPFFLLTSTINHSVFAEQWPQLDIKAAVILDFIIQMLGSTNSKLQRWKDSQGREWMRINPQHIADSLPILKLKGKRRIQQYIKQIENLPNAPIERAIFGQNDIAGYRRTEAADALMFAREIFANNSQEGNQGRKRMAAILDSTGKAPTGRPTKENAPGRPQTAAKAAASIQTPTPPAQPASSPASAADEQHEPVENDMYEQEYKRRTAAALDDVMLMKRANIIPEEAIGQYPTPTPSEQPDPMKNISRGILQGISDFPSLDRAIFDPVKNISPTVKDISHNILSYRGEDIHGADFLQTIPIDQAADEPIDACMFLLAGRQ